MSSKSTHEFVAQVYADGLRFALARTVHAANKDEAGCYGNVFFEFRNGTVYVIAHNRRRMAAAWAGCMNEEEHRIGISATDGQNLVEALPDDGSVIIEATQNDVRFLYGDNTFTATRRRGRTPLWSFPYGDWVMNSMSLSDAISIVDSQKRDYKNIHVIGVALQNWDPVFVDVDQGIHLKAYNADDIISALTSWAWGPEIELMLRADRVRPPLYINSRNGAVAFVPVT